jgi:CRP-like cAMP-binding protein
MDSYDNFLKILTRYIYLFPDEVEFIKDNCKIQKIKKNKIIIQEKAKNYNFYFLLKGMVKYYIVNNEGNEIIYNFKIENQPITSYSLYNNDVAIFNVMCMEDSEFLIISKEIFLHGIKNFKNGYKFRYVFAEEHIIELVNILTEKDSKNVLTRYLNINEKFIDIEQRVSQYQIANYLGITKEYFCRLKKTLNNKMKLK